MHAKAEILKRLATIAPSIAIKTDWTHDPDSRWSDISQCFDPDEDPDGWEPWNSEITASAIHGGKLATGSAYLGGTWERFGDNPEESNPDISGYAPQMIEEALSELLQEVSDNQRIREECEAAIAYVKEWMRKDYERQRNEAA